jgi:hypothetical protein
MDPEHPGQLKGTQPCLARPSQLLGQTVLTLAHCSAPAPAVGSRCRCRHAVHVLGSWLRNWRARARLPLTVSGLCLFAPCSNFALLVRPRDRRYSSAPFLCAIVALLPGVCSARESATCAVRGVLAAARRCVPIAVRFSFLRLTLCTRLTGDCAPGFAYVRWSFLSSAVHQDDSLPLSAFIRTTLKMFGRFH